MQQKNNVQIVEVGPRDGLQAVEKIISTEHKVAFINKLVDAGCTRIEATSFVRPDLVPQLRDAENLCAQLPQKEGVRYSAVVANVKGVERALAAGIKEIAVVAAASETFSKKNIGKSIDESIAEFSKIVNLVLRQRENIFIRGYVSTAFHCPYEKKIPLARVATVTKRLFSVGVQEVSLADTTGKAKQHEVFELLDKLFDDYSPKTLALHMHDTYGNALRNIDIGYLYGIRTFDCAVGGLGGCPFAPNAPGNVATEDVVELFEKRGIHTGVDIKSLVEASRFMTKMIES
jgi:hydroxymethylglutaryl-CoA lyase